MLAVILLYDQLLFRPLVAWSDKFRVELSAGQPPPRSWVLVAAHRTRIASRLLAPAAAQTRDCHHPATARNGQKPPSPSYGYRR